MARFFRVLFILPDPSSTPCPTLASFPGRRTKRRGLLYTDTRERSASPPRESQAFHRARGFGTIYLVSQVGADAASRVYTREPAVSRREEAAGVGLHLAPTSKRRLNYLCRGVRNREPCTGPRYQVLIECWVLSPGPTRAAGPEKTRAMMYAAVFEVSPERRRLARLLIKSSPALGNDQSTRLRFIAIMMIIIMILSPESREQSSMISRTEIRLFEMERRFNQFPLCAHIAHRSKKLVELGNLRLNKIRIAGRGASRGLILSLMSRLER